MKPIEELRELIIDNYIEIIHQDLNDGDKSLLYALLSGKGLKPVSDWTDEDVVGECKELGIDVYAQWADGQKYGQKAALEGWAVVDCLGSEGGRWQIQELDGFYPGQPTDDKRAWAKVVNGTGSHHKSALSFIRQTNPKEYERMINCDKTQP